MLTAKTGILSYQTSNQVLDLRPFWRKHLMFERSSFFSTHFVIAFFITNYVFDRL